MNHYELRIHDYIILIQIFKRTFSGTIENVFCDCDFEMTKIIL